MSIFVNDTFTDTAETLLSAHAGGTGATWTLHPNWTAGAEARISDANRLKSSGSDAKFYTTSGTPAGAEYDVQADFFHRSNVGGSMGICGRMSTSASTAYYVEYSQSNGFWRLWKLLAGSFTSLGTYSQALSADTTYAVKLEIRDAAKKVFIDGVERISSADNAITAAGKAGVITSGGMLDSNGLHLDNFSAADPAGADVTAPEVTTKTIDAAGTTLTVGFSESVTGGTGFTMPGWTLWTASGSGASRTFSITPTVLGTDVPTLNYSPGNVEDAAGNDLAAIVAGAITNNSTQVASLNAGTIAFLRSGPAGIEINSTGASSGGTGSRTYSWHRSTTSGFTPGGGNVLSGQTSATLVDTTASPGTLYYYKRRTTDGASATADTGQVAAQVYEGGSLSGGINVYSRGRLANQ